MKEKGTLSAVQSRYLAGVFSTPLFSTADGSTFKNLILDAYLNSEGLEDQPSDVDPGVIDLVNLGLETGQKYTELADFDSDPEDIVAMVRKSRREGGKAVYVEDDLDDAN